MRIDRKCNISSIVFAKVGNPRSASRTVSAHCKSPVRPRLRCGASGLNPSSRNRRLRRPVTDDERGLCQMKIGAAPISWGISEFPDWGPRTPYEQVFDEMAKAGYAGTELGPPGYLPLDAELLKLELSRRNLAMIAAFVPVNMRNPTAAKTALADVMRTAELLSHLGATQIIVADDGDGHRRAIAGRVEQTVKAGMATDEWESLVHGLHQAATRCADLGLELCVHPHAGSYIEHPSEIERLLEQTDPNLVRSASIRGTLPSAAETHWP